MSTHLLVKIPFSYPAAMVMFWERIICCFSSIQHFQHMLDAHRFTLFTDYRPLVRRFYSHNKPTSPRQSRYLDYIAQFTNEVKHVAGCNNIADSLSRPPDIHMIIPDIPSINYSHLATVQQSDEELSSLRQSNSSSFVFQEVPIPGKNQFVVCDVSLGIARPFIPHIATPTSF